MCLEQRFWYLLVHSCNTDRKCAGFIYVLSSRYSTTKKREREGGGGGGGGEKKAKKSKKQKQKSHVSL